LGIGVRGQIIPTLDTRSFCGLVLGLHQPNRPQAPPLLVGGKMGRSPAPPDATGDDVP
jgi:hypothetical protein